MPIPDYQTLMLPLLKLLAEGHDSVSGCIPALRRQFDISDSEAQELLPSGSTTVLANRAHWARTYLSKSGLLESPKRGRHIVTELGRQVLAKNPSEISNKFLEQFQDFREWRNTSYPVNFNEEKQPTPRPRAVESETPEDAMLAASALIERALRDELLELLYRMDPIRFEKLILDLLQAMGFGKGRIDRGRLTATSGDGGIDGIIHEDALGLDAVFIQAKRYARDIKVGRPDIQRFVGSLTGEGASKGVFVTTSDFSREATQYIDRVQHRLVLINGQRLAQLMIEHEVGVRTRSTYKIRSVDEDYFSGE